MEKPQKTYPSRIVVQKYGGTSVATPEAIEGVARKVIRDQPPETGMVVVVSAMGDTTDHLVDLVRRFHAEPCRREHDAVVATGERVSAALLTLALQGLGREAISLSGPEAGIVTNDVHTNARILEIRPRRVREELARGRVVVVAGFQGRTAAGELTLLGRGGSDTTAVALAAALGAERCEIYTDVEAVYSADPRSVAGARALRSVASREMEELAWQGARVLKAEAVELASTNNVRVFVGSAHGGGEGTWVEPDGAHETGAESPGFEEEVFTPRQAPIAGVAGRRDLLRVVIDPFDAADPRARRLFERLARYDLVFGSLEGGRGSAELLLSTDDMPDVEPLRAWLRELYSTAARSLERLGGVALVGFGLGSRPASLFEARGLLESAGIRTVTSFTSRESMTFVVPLEQVDAGVELLHRRLVEIREPAAEAAPALRHA